jgi:DNA polymerase-3 subunit alpha
VLDSFAKKLVVLLNINDLQTDFIHKLSHLFQENKGDNQVAFEIMELEKIKKIVETVPVVIESEEEEFSEDTDDLEDEDALKTALVSMTEVEEINVVTKLTMPSRRLKIKISNELLCELEKMQINFKLN